MANHRSGLWLVGGVILLTASLIAGQEQQAQPGRTDRGTPTEVPRAARQPRPMEFKSIRSAADRATLRARLEKGYRARADQDRELAAAWDSLSDELWQRSARR